MPVIPPPIYIHVPPVQSLHPVSHAHISEQIQPAPREKTQSHSHSHSIAAPQAPRLVLHKPVSPPKHKSTVKVSKSSL
ncbi:hypothetical protein H0H92_009043 [Tricholoma furcatifolium]|nr:hypothetical protein H0H92_009043 [Tricholoma furcatifolium]